MASNGHRRPAPDLIRETFKIPRPDGTLHKTTIKLTRVHWECLREEARKRSISLLSLIAEIWNARPNAENMAETLRIHCVQYLQQCLRASNDQLKERARVSNQVLFDGFVDACPCPCLIVDTNHIVDSANSAFYRWLHMIPGAASGKRLESLLILRKKESRRPLQVVSPDGTFHRGPGDALYISLSNGTKKAPIQVTPLQSGKQGAALLMFEVLCPPN